MLEAIPHSILSVVYGDKCYLFDGCRDSSLCNLGLKLVRQIFNLLHNNHGDYQAACNSWGNLLVETQCEKMGCDWKSPFGEICEENFEMVLQAYKTKEVLLNGLEPYDLQGHSAFEYFVSLALHHSIRWFVEINLDEKYVCYHVKRSGGWTKSEQIGWHFKQIYLMFLTKNMREQFVPIWLYSYEELQHESIVDPWKFPFHFQYHFLATLVQRQFRRFSAYKKQLEPGGVFFLQAKKRFEVEGSNIAAKPDDISTYDSFDNGRINTTVACNKRKNTSDQLTYLSKRRLTTSAMQNSNGRIDEKGFKPPVGPWKEGSYGERIWESWNSSYKRYNNDESLTLSFKRFTAMKYRTDSTERSEGTDDSLLFLGGEQYYSEWLSQYHQQVKDEAARRELVAKKRNKSRSKSQRKTKYIAMV